jgi:hypothetical protein
MDMHRTKSTTHLEQMIAASFSSSDDDVSLGADQEEAPASTHDATSSSAVPQRRGDVSSQRGQFSHKYKAHWKEDLSM